MGAETIGLLVVVGVIVAVLALYLITIGFALTRLNRTLGSIVGGLTIIRDRTMPVGAVLGDIVTDVDAIEENLDVLLNAVGGASAAPAVASMEDAVAQARGGQARPAAKAPARSPAPANMEEAVSRARDAGAARPSDFEFEEEFAPEPSADSAGPPTVSPAVRATTRTPRPAAERSRPRPKKRSGRSRVPALETSNSGSTASGRSAGRRKQLAIGSGAPPAARTASSAAPSSNGGARRSSSMNMKEAVRRAREKAGAR
jgi:hypothetical protein